MDKFAFLSDRLDELARTGLYRRMVCIDSATGPVVRLASDAGAEKILFCSNNYLNIAQDGHVAEAVTRAVRHYGYGAGASRLISGTMKPHVEVERRFAEFLGKEAALLFGSGFTANEALLRTMAGPGDLVLIDRFDHASIIDAAQACRARFRTYHRNEPDRLERMLADKRYQRKYIVTESVFSMDGDRADLAGLVELGRRYGAILIVDEAHSVGCMGPAGAGLAEELGLLEEVDIVVAPLGKAFGAAGGIVAGPRALIDYLVNKARAFIYTTAPPTVNCVAILAGLDIVMGQPQRRRRLKANADRLGNRLEEIGCNIGGSTTHIVPVIIGDADRAVRISKMLLDAGFFVPAIRPPTVPDGSSRLRISVQCDHTPEQIDALCEAIKDAIQQSPPAL